MIIWLNGAWGSGKTTTAMELYKRLPGSMIYDPEEAGFFINKVLPKELHQSDFQDFKEWREINVQLLKKLANDFDGDIIVPMTLINSLYVEEIIGELSQSNVEIYHFILETTPQTLNQRLDKRFEGKKSWARERIEIAVSSLIELEGAKRIKTDDLSIEEVLDQITKETKIKLLDDNRSAFKKKIDRVLLSLKEKVI